MTHTPTTLYFTHEGAGMNIKGRRAHMWHAAGQDAAYIIHLTNDGRDGVVQGISFSPDDVGMLINKNFNHRVSLDELKQFVQDYHDRRFAA